MTTQNAFSTRLHRFGFEMSNMLVVDQLHEFELGVWKATFQHLVRILEAAGSDLVLQLNERYEGILDEPAHKADDFPDSVKYLLTPGVRSGSSQITCVR